MLLSDSVQDYSKTVMLAIQEAGTTLLEREFRRLEKVGLASMKAEGFAANRIRLERWIDMRYCGQSYELSFPFSRHFVRDFHRHHEKRYGYADPSRASEIVTIRVRVRGLSEKPRIRKDRLRSPDLERALIREKLVRFEGRSYRTCIYERSRLCAGHHMRGPALIFEYSATTARPPGYECRVDSYRNLLIQSASAG